MKIHPLPEEIVKRIAAGEVVERPASVVKELVENALDAGGRHLDLEVKGAGRLLIRVSDDGCGMDKEDLVLSVERHTTSKIGSINDIDQIMTLGFRGEALYSIAAISKIDMMSRTAQNPMGYRLHVEGGRGVDLVGVGIPMGTTIEVRDLFWNTPARLKFLKSSTTEMHHIFDVVATLSLARPDVAFRLKEGEKSWIDVPDSQGLPLRIQGLYQGLGTDWVEVNLKAEFIQVSGYVGHPKMARGDRSHQFFFVNRRPIRSPALGYSIEAAFHSLLPEGRHPVSFIFIEVPPESIDVNIHPSKKEIRFHRIQGIQDSLREAVRRALSCHYSGTTVSQLGDKIQRYPYPQGKPGLIRDAVQAIHLLRPESKAVRYDGSQDRGSKPQESIQEQIPVDGNILENTFGDGFEPLGCYDELYWVFRLRDGLAIIDQHAAHERVLYERYLHDWRQRKLEIQALLISENVQLSKEDHALFEEHQEVLKNLGFGIEEFGGTSVIISQVPHYCETHRLKELVLDILDDLKTFRKTTSYSEGQLEEKIILRACKSAVKAHDAMTREEIKRLFRELLDCELSYTCPHGRPTLIKFTASDLAKMFHRK